MTPTEAVALASHITATWPHPPLTDLGLDVLLETLEPLDHIAACNTIRQMMRTEQFRPTPAAIARHATGVGTPIDRAHDAYMASMRGEQITLPPAVTAVINDLGGWAYCHQQPADHHARFRSAWRNRYGTTDPFNEPNAPQAIAAPPPIAELAEHTGPQPTATTLDGIRAARTALRKATP